MTLSICCATYRGAARIKRLLASIAANAISTPRLQYWELLVIDDGSPVDDLRALMESLHTSGLEHTIVQGSRRGWISAINQIVPQSRGDVILLLDDDAEMPPRLLTVLGDLMATLENVGTLSWRSLGDKPGQSRQPRPGFLQPATELAAYCMAFRRSVWDEVGGLDPRFHVYCSDSDFSLRCARAGHPCYRVWWPLVPHVEHQCFDEAPELDRRGFAERDVAAFVAKWGKSGPEMEAEALRGLADAP